MLRKLSFGLLASCIALAPLPTKAQDTAEVLGDVMSISLKDVVKPGIGFQGALQGLGTPNQAGISGFLPLSVGENSVWYLDALVNVHFGDRDGYSSIINTDVADGFSTSTRLGYRWLSGDRSWMYGLNAGYDSRSLKSGNTDTGVSVTNKKTVDFQQIALSAEAVSNGWTFNAYTLQPIGDVAQTLNSAYKSGALKTYGLDLGYFIKPEVHASVGYYYQNNDEEHVDGSVVRARVSYEFSDGLTAGLNVAHDLQDSDQFDTRVSADLSYRFNAPSKEATQNLPAIQSLASTSPNRDVRVHDDNCYGIAINSCGKNNKNVFKFKFKK